MTNKIDEGLVASLNQVAQIVYDNACEKGFHPREEMEHVFIEQACNNLHDEVSELHEAHRNKRLRALCDKAEGMTAAGIVPLTCVEEELADLVIRVFDDAKQLKIDIGQAIARKHAYNLTRSFRHGNKAC